jgi:hypothetical protein
MDTDAHGLSKDQALPLELWSSKIDEKTNGHPRGLQIIDQLGLMLATYRFHRLELENNEVFYDNICREVSNEMASKKDLERNLFLHLQTGLHQRDHERSLIPALKKTRAKLIEHFKNMLR